MAAIARIESGLEETRYQHRTMVRPKLGQYFFDCSGMAAWILKRTAPGALKSVSPKKRPRPLAVDFYNRITKIKPGERRGAWRRVLSASHIVPGDVIAWKRPKWFKSKSTGHVAFAVESPTENDGPVKGVLVRIADASRYKHEDDSRSPEVTGFGTGILLIPTDEDSQPRGYGWFGSATKPGWVIEASLVIGRPLR